VQYAGCAFTVPAPVVTKGHAMIPDDPAAVNAALDRARAFAEAGKTDAARDVYLQVLARAPDHLRALTDFGALLMRTGFRSAARTVLERALSIEPRSALAHANLAHVLFADTDYEAARAHYEAALAIDPDRAEVHQGLSYTLTRLGREADALPHRVRGFAGRALTTAAFRGAFAPVDVLLLVCAAGGTLYTDSLLDDPRFRVTTLVADLYDVAEPLPHADIVFNAISDADRARAALLAMDQLLTTVGVPVINHPRRVLATGRADNAAQLGALDGVVAPRVAVLALADLHARGAAAVAAAGFTFPLLVRAPGFHTGQHFEYVAQPGDLADAIAGFPAGDVLLIDYVDLRDAAGNVRKYRMMAIDGALYPLHLAVSAHWKVHYFSADMAENAANRALDAAFLRDPEATIGTPACAALERIRAATGLDYLGIDFGIDAAGRVVVFEANATMIVLPPPPEANWDYRRPCVERIIRAVQAMLLARQ
jgi:hypothetical protein